jgi:hypothetical protein
VSAVAGVGDDARNEILTIGRQMMMQREHHQPAVVMIK